MTDESEQLERLLSELHDGHLTEAQLAEARRAIAEDSNAAAAAHGYQRLDAVLQDWQVVSPGMDWEAFARQVSGRVADEMEERDADESTKLAAVDRLIEGSVEPLPAVDWDGLKSRISKAVHEEAAEEARPSTEPLQTWRRVVGWTGRVAVPLAAAAAVAIFFWGPWTSGPPGPDPSAGSIVMVSLEMPDSVGRVTVTFAQEPPANVSEPSPPIMGTAIAVGRPTGDGTVFEEQLDDACFY